MNEHESVAVVRRVYDEIFNEGELDLADVVIAPDAVDHAHSFHSSLPVAEPEALKGFVQAFCSAFPDAWWEIQEIRASDTVVVVRTEMTGTHLDEFMGVAATGEEITMTTVDTVRVEDGQIVEHWGVLPLRSQGKES